MIKPTSECADVMKRLGLLFRQIKTGFTVFCRVGEDKKTLHQAFDSRNKLSFYLYSRNPYFVNISDLPWDMEGGKILSLHNLKTDDGGAKQALSIASGDYVGKQDLIESKPQQFSFEHQAEMDSDARSILVEIFDEINLSPDTHGTPVQSMRLPLLDDKKVFVAVDLMPYPAGIFLIKIDGHEKMKFYADSDLFRDKAFGIVNLFSSDDVQQQYRFTDMSGEMLSESPAVFNIDFQQRKMKWRYHIVMKHQTVAADELKIELDAGAEMTLFNKTSTEPITDTINAVSYPVVMFTSNSLRDFKERPEHSMKLIKGEDIFIQNLPSPSLSSPLKAEQNSDGNYILDSEENKILYCETFVYI